MKRFSFLSLAAAASTAACLIAPAAFAQASGTAATHPFGVSRPIAGQYIVVFKPGVADPTALAASLTQGAQGRLRRTYSGALQGFAANLPEAALPGLRNNPNVQFVEQDQTVSLTQSVEDQATWGLDRIDQADRPLDTQYHYTQTGAGVNAFIIDTGIWWDHVEFTGRMRTGFSVVPDTLGTRDCNGHGTHVAGTVGGTTWGVAKQVALIPVRVLDCNGSGTWSDVIAGIDWVANSTLRPAVANLSLGGGASTAVDAAVVGAVAKGVTMVVAAGNSNADACTASPAREPSAITVGATTNLDARASYSNYGSCVDVFAPGSSITSAYNLSNTSSYVMSGTSMASPHIAGIAALTLQTNPSASPAAVAASILANATSGRLSGLGAGSPNLLANTVGGAAPAPQPATQTVAFKSMTGSAVKTGGNWKASAVVTVRDVNSGATVPNATVSGSFSPGGSASCVTTGTGSCTLTSASIKANASSSTTLAGSGVTGALLSYDPSQNSVSQIVISKP